MGESRKPVLHILGPLCTETPISLAGGDASAAGDWIADLRRFPSAVYFVVPEGREDRTGQLPLPQDAWTAAREWLACFTERTGLQDMLSVDGYGFWWTLNGQRFVAGLTELGNILAWIDLLLGVRALASFRSVSVYGRHETILMLAGQVWREVDVRFTSQTTADRPPVPSRRRRTPGVPRRAGLLIIRAILGLLYLIYAWLRRPEICLFTDTNLMRTVGIGPERRQRDVYMGSVADALRQRGWRVAVVEKYGSNASWMGLRARGWFFPSDVVFTVAALLSASPGFSRGLVEKWRARWREVQPTVVEHLRYRGVDIASLVLPVVRQEFISHAPNLEVMVRIWRALFERWRPRLLYVNNAYGRGSVPAIIAAKNLGIPTIEQQHGLIGRNHIAYLAPERMVRRSKLPLCDIMAVWGEFTRRFLVEAGVYDPSQAVVCGFPRADLLLGRLPSGRKTRAALGIPEQAVVVLYTSNAFAQDAMTDILDGLLHGAPGPVPIVWIVKLHPREKTRELWELAIAERGLQAVEQAVVKRSVHVVEGELDFYALLAACDIHVSFASTTLIEAAILGKPNLGLDLPHTSDPAGYREAGAFLPIAPADLGSVVADLVADSHRREGLLAQQRAFAEDWCIHDGHAVDRIIALVDAVVAEQTPSARPERGREIGRARPSRLGKGREET